MTFKEAKQALKELAAGRFYTLQLKVSEYTDREERVRCSMYVDGIGWTDEFPSYEVALLAIEAMIRQKDQPAIVEEMYPE